MPADPASVPETVLVARHGETAWNVQGRMQGHTDVPLTERGRGQARALAQRLATAPPARIVSSDLSRALETATLVAHACGLDVTIDARLREQDLGAWSGKTFAEVTAIDPVVARRFREFDPDARPPGGETRRELFARVGEAFEAHAGAAAQGPVLLVTHGGALQTLVYRVLGIELSTPRRFLLPNVGLTTIVRRGDAWFVRTLGDVTHLEAPTGDRFPFE